MVEAHSRIDYTSKTEGLGDNDVHSRRRLLIPPNIPLESSPIQAKKELLTVTLKFWKAGQVRGGESSGLVSQYWDRTSPGAPETLRAQRVLGRNLSPCLWGSPDPVLWLESTLYLHLLRTALLFWETFLQPHSSEGCQKQYLTLDIMTGPETGILPCQDKQE